MAQPNRPAEMPDVPPIKSSWAPKNAGPAATLARVSIAVAPEDLADAVARMGPAYLLTLGDRPRPHVGSVHAEVVGGVVRVREVGRTALGDVAGQDAVTLLWAPLDPGGYSLIVDGTATVEGDRVDVVADRAVLHRPRVAPEPGPGACASDCVELPVGPG